MIFRDCPVDRRERLGIEVGAIEGKEHLVDPPVLGECRRCKQQRSDEEAKA